MEGVQGEPVNLTPEVVATLGKSFVQWLKNSTNQHNISVAVGTDSRLSGPSLKAAFLTGMTEVGARVFDCGIASTPAMFMTTVANDNPCTAGVMITASHLPFNRNGLKFFTKEGGLNKKDITEILKLAEENAFSESVKVLPLAKWDFIDDYAAFLVDYIRNNANIVDNFEKPLAGLKIIVDAGNGAGGFFATKVLNELGANTSGSQFLDPDGNFPNHVPNPEDKEAMQSICDAVIREKADLGVIFDTDVDRSAIVDSEGNPINRNALIALISAVILKEHPGSTIVTDSITSVGLATFIEEDLQGAHHRFKRGYKNVINEAIRLNEEGTESWLAIETSGHAALKENYFLDDGAYLVAKLLVEAARLKQEGKTLTDLISDLKRPLESKEYRFSILESDFAAYGKQVLKELEAKIEGVENWEVVRPNYEGLRVSCNASNEEGWFLLRMSLHDPVMPLNIESNLKGGVQAIAHKLSALLEGFTALDIQSIQ